MKQITIRLDEETHKSGKIQAVLQDKSFMQYVVDLIKKDLEEKKSSHAEFGDTRDCSRVKIQKGLCIQFEYSMAFLENQEI